MSKEFSLTRKDLAKTKNFETDKVINKIYEVIDNSIKNCSDKSELPYINILKNKIYGAIDSYIKETDNAVME